MEYNIKIIEHENGSTQISTYADTVGKRRRHSKKISPAIETLESLGFGKCREISLIRWNETASEKEARESLNLQNSIRRTQKRINALARSCEWEYFCTLTFSPDKVEDRTDFQLCMRRVRAWLNNQRKHHAPELKYLAVPEIHRRLEDNGLHAWHVHILLADIGTMIFEDSHKVAIGKKSYERTELYKEFPTIYNLSGWSFGYSTAIPITDNKGHRISHYIVKYISKQLYLFSGGYHKYYASQNLKKAKVSTYNIPKYIQADFVEDYLRRNNKKVIYEKNVSKYVDTTFLEIENQ